MTKTQLAMLPTDWLIYILFFLLILAFIYILRRPHLRQSWRRVVKSRLGMIALVILSFYIIVGLLDSIHLEIKSQDAAGHQRSQIKTVFDLMVYPLGALPEKTYSAPFATHLYNKALVTLPSGREVRTYAKLRYGGKHLGHLQSQGWDISLRLILGFFIGLVIGLMLCALLSFCLAKKRKIPYRLMLYNIMQGKTTIAWREGMLTLTLMLIIIAMLVGLAGDYHILGTDKIGQDVFYESIKSIRTGLLIGTLTTVFMLPFALLLGMFAGYFRGWVDDIIQYIYTTLSSIPGVLLISAIILVLQVYIANHPNLFPTLIQRADARLLALCIILGFTSWANLCRLLRAETLKIREYEYVQAARALGVGRYKVMFRHIMPNIMHIVIITLVLDFSSLVLAEAVLSYVGVGVDPTTISWGNMINSSRLELAREPIVWWPLLAALIFMFVLVLSANLFADAVRDALDPRLRD